MHSEGLFFLAFVDIDKRCIEANDLVSYDANFLGPCSADFFSMVVVLVVWL
jgi:hypothetical protein